MTGPRGKALEEQSQGLLAIATRIALQADLFQREKQYLSSPFAEEGAERAEQRGKVGRQFGLGMLEGLQGTKVILETWARSIHAVFQRLFGGNTGSQLRDIGWILGDMVSGILEVVHAGVIFGSWLKDLAKLLVSFLMIPNEISKGQNPMKPIREAWAGLNFRAGFHDWRPHVRDGRFAAGQQRRRRPDGDGHEPRLPRHDLQSQHGERHARRRYDDRRVQGQGRLRQHAPVRHPREHQPRAFGAWPGNSPSSQHSDEVRWPDFQRP